MEHKRVIGFEIKAVSNAIGRSLADTFSNPDYGGLTGMQNAILGFIMDHEQEQELYQRDIEQEFHIRRSSATVLLQCLEEKGYIQRITVRQDARLKKIVLTEKAVQTQVKVRKAMCEFNQKLEYGITVEEKELLFSILDKVKHNLEQGEYIDYD